jgi:acyltransferase
VHAHRVIFIDLARALAVVFMLYGHTIDALLALEYRVSTWYDVWLFQRGLTSSLFLLLSGFAFSIATSRHWASHVRLSPQFWARARRFAVLVLLGYGLHFPMGRFIDLPWATSTQLTTFFAVDVLQLIGATFLGVQVLALVTRSRTRFAVAAIGLMALIVIASPRVWAVDWTTVLPPVFAAYLFPLQGIALPLFPLFPWSAFILFGVGLGQIYARWGSAHLVSYAHAALLAPGAVLVAASWALAQPPATTWWSGIGATIPAEFSLRAGTCLVLMALIAYASQRVSRLPHVFSAVAQETLVIYFVHLCIVYGSVWNNGLWQVYRQSLGPWPTAGFVVLIVASMTTLAWYWNWLKHARPRAAAWTARAAWVFLIGGLLV